MSKKCVIIGAGLAGLSSAAILADKGYDVVIYEKHKTPGGVARAVQQDGYKFELGPTWYLMPEVFENFFRKFGKNISDYYKLIHLNPSYKVFFEEGGSVVLYPDLETNKKTFDKLEKNGGQKLEKFLKNSEMKYRIAVNEFLYKDYRSFSDFLSLNLITKGLQLNIFSKLNKFVNRYFSDERARKIVEFNTVFLGSSPFKTPALFSLMAHADLTEGVYYPEGGIIQLVYALEKLAADLGVKIQYDQEVENICAKNRKVTGVYARGNFVPCDILLSSADYHHTDSELLEKRLRNYSDKYWKSRVIAPGVMLIFLGIRKKIDNLTHHSFYFAKEWKKHFDTIFEKPEWPENPSYYIGCPSKTDPDSAPEGCENLFILVPVAPGLDDDENTVKSFSERILRHLEKILECSFIEDIETMKIITHKHFKEGNLYKGTALGLSHTLFQSALFRPDHHSRKLSNLYYTGHYTQPGIGMPMAMIGSELVTNHIIKEQQIE